MMQRRKLVVGVSVAVAAMATMMAGSVTAGPEDIAFPQGFETWQMYQRLDRYDVKQYRELYTKPEVVKAVREGKPIPNGTVLVLAAFSAQVDDKGNPLKDAQGRFIKGTPVVVTVMEKRAGWGAKIPAEYRNGDWQYAAFLPDGKPNAKANANTKPCFDCHLPHAGQDFVMSLAGLAGTAPGAAPRPSGPGTVGISQFLFGPEKIAVRAGQTITWTNVDDSPHQVTVQGETTARTPVLLKGQSTALSFAHVGSYDYICGLHPGMKGTIEVTK